MEAFRNSPRQAHRYLDLMATKAAPLEYREWQLTPRATSGSPAMGPTACMFFSAATRITLYSINSILEVSHLVSYLPRMEPRGSPMAADWTARTLAVSRSTRS